jgi:hypothetical protein
MKKLLSAALVAIALTLGVSADVVRPAPNFAFEGASKSSLKALHGQPVVLLIAKSAKDWSFNRQLKFLKGNYQEFAARDVVFVAALQDASEPIKSNIPISLAKDGAQVASAYEVEKGFAIVIIGKDGNIDLQTPKVISGERVREVLINSYPVQAPERK